MAEQVLEGAPAPAPPGEAELHVVGVDDTTDALHPSAAVLPCEHISTLSAAERKRYVSIASQCREGSAIGKPAS